ncbi:MAG: ATP-dependent helicase [Deltaproteobacteria bacterium]|jgi:DNA helicase-2/ATP-dependent DNA helicase PcrA|nr:ATP-dependent helicase [Deltaproteobacteria bacterium]
MSLLSGLPRAEDLARQLNEAQRRAVTFGDGPLLIVAGAGSGKTLTLVHRVAWLVAQGFDPASILLLTFTRKASAEMLARCTELVGTSAGRVSGGTFHSLANHLLRAWAHRLGYGANFAVMDQDDAETLMSRLRRECEAVKTRTHFPRSGAILNVVSQAVNKELTIVETVRTFFPHFADFAPTIELLAANYRDLKRQSDLMDFDDLLVNLERLLRDHEDARLSAANRFRHILVDEYQDTNPLQARLTFLLGRDHRNVTAVGDEAQSIYSFRGASFRNIMDFPALFPGAEILKLEENYRSRPPVLTLANRLLRRAKERYDKTLKARRGGGVRPRLALTADLAQEAAQAVAQIESALARGLKPQDLAVLFRASSHSFELEAQLTRRRIPYVKHGGRKLLDMAHVKDFLSILRLAVNPADAESLRRVLGFIPGLGPAGASKLIEWHRGRGGGWSELLTCKVSHKVRQGLQPLVEALKAMRRPEETVKAQIETAREYYFRLLPELYPDDHPGRRVDVAELLPMAQSAGNLLDFLTDLTLDPPASQAGGRTPAGPGGPSAPNGGGEERQTLTLSTIHSAKGLEWPAVIILSAVEGRFPAVFGQRTAEDLEEELRLMYVAVTRAMDELTIYVPLQGQLTFQPRSGRSATFLPTPGLSRFLSGLDDETVEVWRDGRRASWSTVFGAQGYGEALTENEDEAEDGAGDDVSFYGPPPDPKPPKVLKPSVPKSPASKPETSGASAAGSSSPGTAMHKAGRSAKTRSKTAAVKPFEPAKSAAPFKPQVGQRVRHPAFGAGRVLLLDDGRAVIDFDQYGKKSVIIQFAKLSSLDR